MQQGDYASYYQFPHYQNPNPNPNPIPNSVDHHQQSNPYASAPPFSSNYSTPPPAPAPVPPPPPTATTDYSPYSQVYPPYPQNPDPLPPTPTAPQPQQPPSFPPYDSHGPYQPPSNQSLPYFPPFDQHQSPPAYNPPAYSAPAPYNPPPAPTYDSNPYDNSVKYDQSMGYYDGGYNRSSRSDLGSDLYGDGVYAYEGGKVEPYGARGTAPKSSTWARFDDYGRPITVGDSGKESSLGSGSGSGSGSNSGSSKIVRAVPKAETQEDVKGGVQKFRVKLLAESSGQSTMDVLCQIGLDGIRMLDPSTSRTLRIYPIENITRCDVTDASTFAFWSKSSVDIEPRRIRLQSSRYTTNTLLDTVTAAIVQVKEIGGRSRPSEAPKVNEQSTERKKGLTDWMNIIKPGNEEKDHWVPDEAVSKCTACGVDFGAFNRRHHCRNCGDIFCDKCTHGRIALTADENAQPVRVCDRCLGEVTQRLSNAKEAASKPQGLQSHEDLARKLQEEMEKNRKAASGSKSDGSGKRMREVACPTCTVHLQVQVPSSGSETIECGVCQHPFLVSAH